MAELRLVKGNTFRTLCTVRALDVAGDEIEGFDLHDAEIVTCTARTAYTSHDMPYEVMDDNKLLVTWEGLPIGTYGLEVTGKYGGESFRFYDRAQLDIVATNAEGNIPEESFIADGVYRIVSSFVVTNFVGYVQSDWAEEDEEQADYIKNKPQIPTVPTNVSAFVNDASYTTTDWIQDNYYDKDALDQVYANLATVAKTGDYTDLDNKPDLSVYATTATLQASYYDKATTDSKLSAKLDKDTILVATEAEYDAASDTDKQNHVYLIEEEDA